MGGSSVAGGSIRTGQAHRGADQEKRDYKDQPPPRQPILGGFRRGAGLISPFIAPTGTNLETDSPMSAHGTASKAITLIFAAMGVFTATQQVAKTTTFRHAEAAFLAPYTYSAIIWATLMGWLFWREVAAPAGAASDRPKGR
jgi:drug/metabolite transporter (DMT)-like permease